MRALRLAIPAPARAARSAALCQRVLDLPEVGGARAVALFAPMEERGEVDLRPAHVALRERGLAIHYPFVRPGEPSPFGFAPVDRLESLSDRGRGFLEPPEEAPRAGERELDVIVVPCLAVATSGHRLGYGAGFYDQVLPIHRPPAMAVVVAFDFQLLADLPVREGDVPCDVLVTDARTLRVGLEGPSTRD